MKRFTAAIIVAFALLGATPAGSDEAPVCQEDEPCWDCETMGNLVCGPVDVGEPLVIEAASAAAPAAAAPTFTG